MSGLDKKIFVSFFLFWERDLFGGALWLFVFVRRRYGGSLSRGASGFVVVVAVVVAVIVGDEIKSQKFVFFCSV